MNETLEERVELLEIQMAAVQDEVSDLEANVDFLFDEMVIQDERLFQLETETEGIEENVEGKLTGIVSVFSFQVSPRKEVRIHPARTSVISALFEEQEVGLNHTRYWKSVISGTSQGQRSSAPRIRQKLLKFLQVRVEIRG